MRDLINAVTRGLKSGKPAKRYTLYAIFATTALLILAILTLLISSIAFSAGGNDKDTSDSSNSEVDLSASLSLVEKDISADAASLFSGELLIFNSDCPYNADSLNKNDLVSIDKQRSKKPEADADFDYYYSIFLDMAKSATSATAKALDAMICDYYAANNNDDNLIVSKAAGSGGSFESGLLIELRYYNGDDKDPVSAESHVWLYTNAYKYGFINVTGNTFRYVGIPHATYMQTEGITTLEAYMDVLRMSDKTAPLDLGNGYYAFFVPNGEMGAVSSEYATTVSGNNSDGYVVTVDKNTTANN